MAETTDYKLEHAEASSATEVLGLDSAEYVASTEAAKQRQQVSILFRQAPLGIAAVLLLSFGLTAALWNQIPQYLLLPWLAFISLNSLLHVILLREYSRQDNRINAITSWTRYETMLAGASALAWSVGFVLMLPHLTINQQLLYLILLSLLCTLHLPVLGSVFQSYLSFVALAAVPALLALAFASDPLPVAWLVTGLLMATALLLAARNYNNVLLRAFHLADENQQHIAELYQSHQKTREDNANLKKAVHDHLQNGQRLNAERLSSELTLRSIKEAVITTNLQGRVMFMNPLAEEYTGWTSDLASGKPAADVVRIIDEQTRVHIDDPVVRCLHNRTAITESENSVMVRRDGLEYGIEFDVSPIRDAEAEVTGAVFVIRDITQRRDLLRTLSWQAAHDPLTGLINRREFEQRLQHVLQNIPGENRQHILCFIDLDNFKQINDTYGHMAGDALLKHIAVCLREKVRETDTLARIGGDEFGLILYSCGLERAQVIAEAMRKALTDIDFKWEHARFQISASIGIVTVNHKTTAINDTLRTADLACYEAKENGGNQVVLREPNESTDSNIRNEARWAEIIIDSIRNRKFKLFIQSIKPLDEENPTELHEILLRVSDDNDRVVMPRRFLTIAQRHHLLPQIDISVLESVLKNLEDGHPHLQDSARLTMSLSGQTVSDGHSLDQIADLLRKYHKVTERLCFEFDEKSLVSEPGRSEQLLDLLRRYGCRITIDDFGFSLGAFRYLHSLKLDYIRIDARHIHDPTSHSLDYTLVEAINLLSHRIGAQTIVKNVSSGEILEALQGIGVDYVQGHLIEKPRLLVETMEDKSPGRAQAG